MQHKSSLKQFRHSIIAAALSAASIGFVSLAHAADRNDEDQAPTVQPEANQPQQQATPAHPSTESESPDAEEDTALV